MNKFHKPAHPVSVRILPRWHDGAASPECKGNTPFKDLERNAADGTPISPAPAQEIHLLPDNPAAFVDGHPTAPTMPLVVPHGPSILVLETHSGDSSESPTRHTQNWEASPIIEPLFDRQHRLCLLILPSDPERLRVNGEPAPRLTFAREMDLLQCGDAAAWRIAIFQRPVIGPPEPQLVGRECQVCRVPFQAEARCYQCACGAALHCEDDRADGLLCAHLRAASGCPGCRRPLVFEAGYKHETEAARE